MNAKRRHLQYIALFCMLLLLVCTFLSFFIAPRIADAHTRKKYGLPEDAFITDTARTPWVYIDEEGGITLHGDKMIGMTTLYIPSAVNGIKTQALAAIAGNNAKIKTLVIPAGVEAKNFAKWHLCDFTSLEAVVFEEGITDISGCSLSSSVALERVYLPRSIKTLSTGFLKSEAPVTICYAGTEEEWLALGGDAKKLCDRYTIVFETEFSAQ